MTLARLAVVLYSTREGKGREGKGRKGKGRKVSTAHQPITVSQPVRRLLRVTFLARRFAALHASFECILCWKGNGKLLTLLSIVKDSFLVNSRRAPSTDEMPWGI